MKLKHFRISPKRRKFRVTQIEQEWNSNHTTKLIIITLRDPIPKVVGSLMMDGQRVYKLNVRELWVTVDTVNENENDFMVYPHKQKNILSISSNIHLDVSRAHLNRGIDSKVWLTAIKFISYGTYMRSKR